MQFHEFELDTEVSVGLSALLGGRGPDTDREGAGLSSLDKKIEKYDSQILDVAERISGDFEEGLLSDILSQARKLLVPTLLGKVGESDSEAYSEFAALLEGRSDGPDAIHTLTLASAETLPTFLALPFSQTLEALFEYAQRVRQATLIQNVASQVAEEASKGFSIYLKSEGQDPSEDFQKLMTSSLESYLKQSCRIQKQPQTEELPLLHCLIWLREVGARFELDLGQWSFLVASVEQSIYKTVGPESAQFFSRYTINLSQTLGQLSFASEYLRNLEKIAVSMLGEKNFPHLKFEWELLIQCLLADVLQRSTGKSSSVLCRTIMNDERPLGGISPDDFHILSRLIVNASRSLMERNWLDKIEDTLKQLLSCLQFKKSWLAKQDDTFDLCSETLKSLKDTLPDVDEDLQVEEDVWHLLKTSAAIAHSSNNLNHAIEDFTSYFLFGYGLYHGTDWDKLIPAIKGTVTAFTKSSPIPYLAADSSALKVFASLEESASSLSRRVNDLEAASQALQEFPTNKQHATLFLCLVQRLTLENCRGNSDQAVRMTAGWALNHLQFAQHSDQLSVFFRKIQKSALPETLRNDVKALSGWVPRLKLHQGLWDASTEIGLLAATEVYSEMPEYKRTTGGEEGLAKCARDSAFTLRKLSQSLAPQIKDPQEAFAAEWRNLVDRYVANRPAGLFRRTSEALIQASGRVLDETTTALLARTLSPVYLDAEGETSELSPQDVSALGGASSMAKSEHKKAFSTRLQNHMNRVPCPDISAKVELESFLLETLPDGLSAFFAGSELSKRTINRLNSETRKLKPQEFARFELYLSQLREAVGEEMDSNYLSLRDLSIIQSVLEHTRLLRLRKALESLDHASLPSEYLPLLKALYQPLGENSAPWSRLEALSKSLEQLVQIESERTSDSSKAVSALLNWGSTSLDPPLLQEFCYFLSALEKGLSSAVISGFFVKLNSQDFLFSPSPVEEEQWRTLMAWSLFCKLEAGTLPPATCVVSTLEICREFDFPQKLSKGFQFLISEGDTQWSQHLKQLRETLSTLCEGRLALQEEREEIEATLAEALKSEGLELESETLLEVIGSGLLAASTSDRFKLPSQAFIAAEAGKAVLSLLPQQGETLQRLGGALEPEVGQLWESALKRLEQFQQGASEFADQWKRCQGQTGWLRRRQLIDVLTGEDDAFEWFRREFCPYQSAQSLDSIVALTRKYNGEILVQDTSDIALKIKSIDLLRNVTSAALQSGYPDSAKLAMARQLPSIKRRENALNEAVSPHICLVREFDSPAAQGIAVEQLLGLNSRLTFERLKALFSSAPDTLRGDLEKEQMETLSQARSTDSVEFFARWDLLERRADLVATVELTEALRNKTFTSRVSAQWVHSISSFAEPSVLGHFLSLLPHDLKVEEVHQLRDDIKQLATGNPRVTALLNRWTRRMTLVEEHLEFLTEPSLKGEARALVVGAICALEDDSVGSALRFDRILQSRDGETQSPGSRYSAALVEIQDLFLASDLTYIRREVEARQELEEMLIRLDAWKGQVTELEERLWSLFPSNEKLSREEHRSLLEALPLILCQPRRTPTYWRMSSILVGIGSRALEAFQQSRPEDAKKWQMAVLNAAARVGLPRRPFEEGFAQLNVALEAKGSADAVVRSQSSDKLSPALLLSMKIASDLLNGTLDPQEASRWLVGATADISPTEPNAVVKSVKGLLAEWSRGQYPEVVKDAARSIKLRLETAASRSKSISELIVALDGLAEKSDAELEQNRGWFAKLSDSFEAVVRG